LGEKCAWLKEVSRDHFAKAHTTSMVIAVITPVADPIKLYFFPDEEFLCFTLAATLGHFNISYFFLHVTKHSNYTAKIGK